MAASGRERHRDRDPGLRQLDAASPPSASRIFSISDAQRQRVIKALRLIDEATRALEAQQNRANREIIRELKASADRIFALMNALEEIDHPTGGIPDQGRK